LIKRSITLEGHKTSLALEAEFWLALEEIAADSKLSIPALVAKIDQQRKTGNLSSALRIFALEYFTKKNVSQDQNNP